MVFDFHKIHIGPLGAKMGMVSNGPAQTVDIDFSKPFHKNDRVRNARAEAKQRNKINHNYLTTNYTLVRSKVY